VSELTTALTMGLYIDVPLLVASVLVREGLGCSWLTVGPFIGGFVVVVVIVGA